MVTAALAGEPRSFTRTHLVASIAGFICGHNEAIVQPVLVGLLVDERHLSQRLAGLVSTIEMSGFAVGALACAWLARRISWYRLLAIALLAGSLANVLCGLTTSTPTLMCLRFVPGFAAGLALSLATAAASRSPTAERSYGVIFACVLVYPVVILRLLPVAIHTWGVPGFFTVIACVQLFALLAMWWLPPPAFASHTRANLPAPAPRLLGSAKLAILAATAFLYAGHTAIWTYEERMGVALGVDSATVIQFLGTASAFGILGAVIAALQRERLGQIWPQIISLIISVAATVTIVFSSTYSGYQVSAILIVLAWFYGAPYVNALAARLDPSGTVAAWSGGMFALGLATGPLLAATIVGDGSYSRIGIVAACMYACCLLLLLPVASAYDRDIRSVAARL
jgi:predicted MFS family arabinose efflux permease